MVLSLSRDEEVASKRSGLSRTAGASTRATAKPVLFPGKMLLGQPQPPPNQCSLSTQEVQGEPSELLGQPAARGQERDWAADGHQSWGISGGHDRLWDATPDPLIHLQPLHLLSRGWLIYIYR